MANREPGTKWYRALFLFTPMTSIFTKTINDEKPELYAVTYHFRHGEAEYREYRFYRGTSPQVRAAVSCNLEDFARKPDHEIVQCWEGNEIKGLWEYTTERLVNVRIDWTPSLESFLPIRSLQ